MRVIIPQSRRSSYLNWQLARPGRARKAVDLYKKKLSHLKLFLSQSRVEKTLFLENLLAALTIRLLWIDELLVARKRL
jgi:hypothetical protein